MVSRFWVVFAILNAFAVLNTYLLVLQLITVACESQCVTSLQSSVTSSPGLEFVQTHSIMLTPASWLLVGISWIWRGRMKSKWTRLGFDIDIFRLFVKMKGGANRLRLLNVLSTPKDRMQMAKDLGLDWKTVDRHIRVLDEYGLVRERMVYGNVKLYELTPVGRLLAQLIDEISRAKSPGDKEELEFSSTNTHVSP